MRNHPQHSAADSTLKAVRLLPVSPANHDNNNENKQGSKQRHRALSEKASDD